MVQVRQYCFWCKQVLACDNMAQIFSEYLSWLILFDFDLGLVIGIALANKLPPDHILYAHSLNQVEFVGEIGL